MPFTLSGAQQPGSPLPRVRVPQPLITSGTLSGWATVPEQQGPAALGGRHRTLLTWSVVDSPSKDLGMFAHLYPRNPVPKPQATETVPQMAHAAEPNHGGGTQGCRDVASPSNAWPGAEEENTEQVCEWTSSHPGRLSTVCVAFTGSQGGHSADTVLS